MAPAGRFVVPRRSCAADEPGPAVALAPETVAPDPDPEPGHVAVLGAVPTAGISCFACATRFAGSGARPGARFC